MQVIRCVYMPFFDRGNKNQLSLFVETLDMLQSLFDTYAHLAPIKLVGDFNTQLPTDIKLGKNWFKKKGFSTYSHILYDFLDHNNLMAVDLLYKQPTAYTFFCHKNRHYTWIDHIICSRDELIKIKSCQITPEEPNNLSDHLPVQVVFSLSITKNYNAS